MWPADGFEAELSAFDRIAVLYHEPGAASAALATAFAEAGAFSSVPVARAEIGTPADPRIRTMRLRALPTLAYYEHGEELERMEAKPGREVQPDEVEAFFATIEEVQETWRVIRGRLRVDKFG